jgi:hypothetical protein
MSRVSPRSSRASTWQRLTRHLWVPNHGSLSSTCALIHLSTLVFQQKSLTARRIDVPRRLRRAILLNDLPLVQRIIRNNHDYLRNPDYEDKSSTNLHLAAKHGFTQIAVGRPTHPWKNRC